MTLAELEATAVKMRELGIVKLRTPDAEIELGPLHAQPKPSRELSDDDYMFAATEGIEEPEDPKSKAGG